MWTKQLLNFACSYAVRVLLCYLDNKVKFKGEKVGVCDGVPSTAALVSFNFISNMTTFRK